LRLKTEAPNVNGLAAMVAAGLVPVLAQVEKVTKVHWPKGQSPAAIAGLLFVIAVVSVVLVVVIVRRLVGMLREGRPGDAVFAELSRAHGLSREEEKLLRETVSREKLPDPARIFVEKRHLEAYAKSSTDPAYRGLYEKLFGR